MFMSWWQLYPAAMLQLELCPKCDDMPVSSYIDFVNAIKRNMASASFL